MDIEYRSGAFYPSKLKTLPVFKLCEIYSRMRIDGLKFGVNPDFYPEKRTFTSVDQALAYCAKLHSSIVANKESMRAIELEEQTPIIKDEEVAPIKEQIKMPRKPKMKLPADSTITILVEGNPKKRTAAERFDLYKNGMTVQEYLEISPNQIQAMNDILWDMDHGWIRVEIATEYEEAV